MTQKDARQAIKQVNVGCSSIAWDTKDGKHIWGRNFDFNSIAESFTMVVPRNFEYYTSGTEFDHNLSLENVVKSKYAAVGLGTMSMKTTPVFYDGINEKGLMGGQLYYADFASFPDEVKPNSKPLNPGFVVSQALLQCASVEEVIDLLTKQYTVINEELAETLPTVHWAFSDRSGETIIVEPDNQQMTIYRHTAGVLTNSPSYDWHKQNLLSYLNVQNTEFPDRNMDGVEVKKPFKGTGALGLPGDFTAQSRFIRASFLKYYGIKGKNEDQGIEYFFHLLDNVAMPLGMIKVADGDDPSAYDETIYSSAMCAESKKFYWRSYENSRIHCVDLNLELDNSDIKLIPLENKAPDFKFMK